MPGTCGAAFAVFNISTISDRLDCVVAAAVSISVPLMVTLNLSPAEIDGTVGLVIFSTCRVPAVLLKPYPTSEPESAVFAAVSSFPAK